MTKWVSILALSVAVIVASVSGLVIYNKKEAIARAEASRAESLEAAAKDAARKAQSEEKAERAKADAAEDARKAAEQNRIAKEAELDAQIAAEAAAEANRAAAEAKRAAEEAEANRADAERATAKAAAEQARAEAERARREAEREKLRAEAAKASEERERMYSERVKAEERLRNTKMSDLEDLERELVAYKRELDERERALRPDKTIMDIEGAVSEDVVFDADGVARKVEKLPYLAENDRTIPRESRELARTQRLVAEAREERDAAVRKGVAESLEALYERAVERDDVPSAEMYLAVLRAFYPDWQRQPKNEEGKEEATK